MENNIKSNTTFWTEINSYKIRVPYYQRDYAQGRIDDRIDNIRKVFVEELFQAISTEERTCHLGLVFGSYDETNKIFIAVDGQQRLTTVFLLHWYVAWREGKINDYKEQLVKFSWDTRSYSSQFVNLLFRIGAQDNIVDAIKSHSDYFSIWENDPTVKGMLTMLEEIERQYPKVGGLCQKLFSDDCNIRYDILKLEKDSDGKTYLKMNSRGRSLTTFELFKSKFIDEYKPTFGNKFDNAWLNFMLTMAKNTTGQFGDPDISFMNFINEYVYLKLRLKEDKNASQEFINAKMKGDLTDVPFISFDHYKIAFDGDLDSFEKSFDWIISNYETIKRIDDNLRFKDSHFFIDAIIRDNNPNYSHRTKLVAAIRFAQLTAYESIDELLYKKWTRVIRNLVANSNIDAENFSKICRVINEINKCDIYQYISNDGLLGTFDKDQVAEEIAKAKKIIEDSSWEELINDAERCPYLLGKIWVLFQNGEQTSKELFGKRYFILKSILDNQDTCYLPKILLSYYNKEKPKLNFELKKTITNWKKLLTDKKNGLFDCFQKIESDTINPNIQYQWIKDIAKTNLLNCSRDNAKIVGRYGNSVILWGTTGCKRNAFGNEVGGNVIIGNHRTILVDGNLELQNKNIVVPNTNFVSYFDVNFRYNSHCFQWYGVPNEKELDVYLMEDEWANYIKRPNYEEGKLDKDNHYCFRVTQEMESDTSLFTKALDRLIDEAFSK